MPGATDDRGEDGAGSVISGESGLAHSGAIVHNEGSNFVVAHLLLLQITETFSKEKLWKARLSY